MCLSLLNASRPRRAQVEPWDKRYQYLLFAAEPYEVISFKARRRLCPAQRIQWGDDTRTAFVAPQSKRSHSPSRSSC